MDADELAEIEERAEAATPGPWYAHFIDDDHFANLVAVSTKPESVRIGHSDTVAATLIQFPARYVDIADERWDENAYFIAHARQDIPRLLAEVRRLRKLLES
ncbi:MAG TPA: hypothetical protein VF062_05720 [Candidatus Limnocylindrales bacterium]